MSRLARLFERFRPSRGKNLEVDAAVHPKIGWVLAGLGNPGANYRDSRHNLGFRAVDLLAPAREFGTTRRRFKGRTCRTRIGDQTAILVQPQTYYNLSGECLRAVLGYFHLPPDRLVVVHDDLDLERGRTQVKRGGGDAGNRGVRSIAEALGTADFFRVRIGIGRPDPDEDAKDYVLKPMSAREQCQFAPTIERAARAAAMIITDGVERAMNVFNSPR